MKRTVLMLVLTLAFGIVLGVLGNQALNAQQEPVKRTVLQKVDLGDKEGTMYVAEIAPGASSGKHFHPGPESIYLLGGTMTLEKEGHPAMTLKSGDSASMPSKHVHEAKNESATEAMKVLVFLVAEKGQPLATAVTPPYFWKK
jgi:quercetin dioxygenase-like cupin family protein